MDIAWKKIMKTIKKPHILLCTAMFFVLILAGCSLASTNIQETQKPVEKSNQTPPVSETQPEIMEETSQTAKYKIEFIAEWSSKTHSDFNPLEAHFSPFVAYSHNGSNEAAIFSLGKIPTAGVEEMSESGDPNILINEIRNKINSGLAYAQTKGSRIDSPGNDISELNFSQEYSFITFVSMLAPSPDWFVAGSVNLLEGNKWIERIEINLKTYDSGGDSG